MTHAQEYPTERLCHVLEVRSSSYYAWLGRQKLAGAPVAQVAQTSQKPTGTQAAEGPSPSKKQLFGRNQMESQPLGSQSPESQSPGSRRKAENAAIVSEMKRIDVQMRHRYGSPRMHAELGKRGFICNRKRVERLMRQEGIHAIHSKRKRRPLTTQSKHNLPLAPNLLNRDFSAEAPNTKWVTDITYIATDQGWLYLAVVLDLYSRKVVGWAMETTVATELPLRALRMALRRRRPPAGLLHHSDRGSQYASAIYQALLHLQTIQPSMSRKADCWDNAVMESFFSTLKAELVNWTHFTTIAEARSEIFHFIEAFYNRIRLHSTLDYNSPDEFESKSLHGG